jgi:hypothetical protein
MPSANIPEEGKRQIVSQIGRNKYLRKPLLHRFWGIFYRKMVQKFHIIKRSNLGAYFKKLSLAAETPPINN